ncbi:MAG TPA: hypothetical protein VF725_05210 [Ktedonobacterales bacterium]
MNQTSHYTTFRQTHRAATTLLPVLTATLTVAGALIAALEARASRAAPTAAEAEELTSRDALTATPATRRGSRGGARGGAGRVTARAYIATLAGRALLVALGVALVCALIYTFSVSGRTGQAILLTALVLLTLYLTEKVARRA